MSLHIFAILFDCYIIWLYMRILKLFLGNIFFCNFFLSFIFSVWSVRMVYSCIWMGTIQTARRSSDTSGHKRFSWRMTWQRASGWDKWCVQTVNLQSFIASLSPYPPHTLILLSIFPFLFDILACFFSCFLASSRLILSLCALSLHFGYFALSFAFFSVLFNCLMF